MSNEKVVFITASGGGMGEAQARLFSNNGYKVYLTDINEKSIRTISKDINLNGGETAFSKLDVTDEKEWKKNLAKCIKKFKRIDLEVSAGSAVIFLSSLVHGGYNNKKTRYSHERKT